MAKTSILLVIIGVCLGLQQNLLAMDRALLIGIGKYRNQIEDLPGVKIDIANMQESAQLMGYQEEQIKVIMNEEATLANLKATIKSWLIDGTNEDDRVLIYFSGHGSRIPDFNGDEKDGADEVLVMYDSQIVKKNNKKTIKNALLDDELNRYLKQLKSQDVMLLVDACNSGTVYRGFAGQPNETTAVAKFLSYSGIPKNQKRKQLLLNNHESNAFDAEHVEPGKYQFVALTAAGDDELALATKNGSLFTSGIKYYLQEAARNNQSITPKQLSEKVTQYIQDKVQREKLGAVYQPQLAGNQQLVNKTIPVSPIFLGKNWHSLEQLTIDGTDILLSSSKSNLRIGDLLEIHLEIPQSGYLNVLNIDPSDTVYIVYPSSSFADNRVRKGKLILPTPDMGYSLQLTEPSGDNLFLAIITQQPINAYQGMVKGNRLDGGKLAGLIKNQASENYLIGKLVLEVKDKSTVE